MNQSDNTFLFIPDISGFSRFVNQTEVNHSRHILSELLELIITEDQLGLEVLEVEGDAIFFNKAGKIPSLYELYEQCRKTFLAFHNYLQEYEVSRICHCGACSTAYNLSLKFIAHAGPVQPISIKNHKKLHGNDVIVSHRLLKNHIPSDEYFLLTDVLYEEMAKDEAQPNNIPAAEKGEENYEHFGAVAFRYYDLKPLHHEIQTHEKAHIEYVKSNTTQAKSHVTISPLTLFEIISNLRYRKNWNKAVSKMNFKTNHTNRAQDTHNCVINNIPLTIETLQAHKDKDKMIYGERVEKIFFMKNILMFYNIENHEKGSYLTVEISFEMISSALNFMKPLIKKYLNKMLNQLIKDIKNYAEKEHKTQSIEIDKNKLIRINELKQSEMVK